MTGGESGFQEEWKMKMFAGLTVAGVAVIFFVYSMIKKRKEADLA